ncbi:MAG: copper resistance protein NlpE N-terminal domain-containing protein [Bacteroidota bacterium]
MKKVLLFTLVAWTIISCERNSKNVVVVYDTINNDTTLIKIDSIAPDKNFAGILPCKGCDGINVYLTLHQDSSFHYTESKKTGEVQDSIIEQTGKYKLDSNEVAPIIDLKFTDGGRMYFQIYGDTALQLLSRDKKEIKTDKNTFLRKN